MAGLGRHVVVDGTDVVTALLDDKQRLVEILSAACVRAGAAVLGVASHHFTPQGVTALILLAESHASIHTWPEKRAYCADVFTCGNVDPMKIARELCAALGGRARMRTVSRGEGAPAGALGADTDA